MLAFPGYGADVEDEPPTGDLLQVGVRIYSSNICQNIHRIKNDTSKNDKKDINETFGHAYNKEVLICMGKSKER